MPTRRTDAFDNSDPPVSPVRSALMARVKRADTSPEMAVRHVAHSLGFRFRLHRADLPGTPDLVFPKLKKVIFVHGCFWHRHAGCSRATTPKTRRHFWIEKFEANLKRDYRALSALRKLGWDALVIWECETLSKTELESKIASFLFGSG